MALFVTCYIYSNPRLITMMSKLNYFEVFLLLLVVVIIVVMSFIVFVAVHIGLSYGQYKFN